LLRGHYQIKLGQGGIAFMTLPRIEDMAGLWRRSLIAWPDGTQDTTTSVSWLQGLATYIDLRQPADRPAFTGVAALADLDAEDVAWLARQEGFAGTFVFDGTWFEWQREIDFQPQALYSDSGSLRYEDDYMIEEGRDVPYVEHWHRDTLPGAPVAAVSLISDEGAAALLRVGDLFMYARARAQPLDGGKHLSEHVAGAASLAQAQAMIDCEISLGRIQDDAWIIRHSTLPYRECLNLAPKVRSNRLEIRETDMTGRTFARSFRLDKAEGELSALGS